MANGQEFPAQAAVRHVDETFTFMQELAQQWTAATQASLGQMAAWVPPEEGQAPTLPGQRVSYGELPDFGRPDPQRFGDVHNLTPPAWFDYDGMIGSFTSAMDALGDFTPTGTLPNFGGYGTINTEPSPSAYTPEKIELPQDPGLDAPPEDPDFVPITLPTAPSILFPDLGDLGDIPVFDDVPPVLELGWQPTEYQPLVLNKLAETINLMLEGRYAMPPAVQEAIWGEAVERENATARQRREEAFSDWAGRGFSMPPGMLVEQVNAINDAAMRQANTLSREAYKQAAQWSIENLRVAVSQGIALEGMWSQHWNTIENRALDAAQATLNAKKEGFNLRVLAFQTAIARIEAVRAKMELLVRIELAKLDQYKAEIEAEVAKGQLNEQLLRLYLGKLERIKTIADIYNTKMEGVIARGQHERNMLEANRLEFEVWDRRLRTLLEKRGQDVQVDIAKLQLRDTELRQWVSMYESARNRDQSALAALQTKLGAIEASARRFAAELSGEEAQVRASAEAIRGRAQGYDADMRYLESQMRYETTQEDGKVRAAEATARNNIAQLEVRARQYDAWMQRLIVKAQSLLGAIQAGGQMSAQLAAGSMSALHASASVSGSGSSSNSYSESHNYSYEGN